MSLKHSLSPTQFWSVYAVFPLPLSTKAGSLTRFTVRKKKKRERDAVSAQLPTMQQERPPPHPPHCNTIQPLTPSSEETLGLERTFSFQIRNRKQRTMRPVIRRVLPCPEEKPSARTSESAVRIASSSRQIPAFTLAQPGQIP